MKQKTIKDEMFLNTIILTYGTNEELLNWYKKNGINNHEVNKYHEAFVEYVEKETKEAIELKFHIHFSYYEFSLIVHETNHLAFRILDRAGIKLNESTTEIFAYYQDWIARKIRDQFELWTKSKTKRKK